MTTLEQTVRAAGPAGIALSTLAERLGEHPAAVEYQFLSLMCSRVSISIDFGKKDPVFSID